MLLHMERQSRARTCLGDKAALSAGSLGFVLGPYGGGHLGGRQARGVLLSTGDADDAGAQTQPSGRGFGIGIIATLREQD